MKNLFLLTLLVGLSLNVFSQNTLSYTSKDKNFRKGLELLDREKYSAASHFFEKYLENNPDRLLAVEASYYIAFCSMYLENNQAEKYIGKFIADYPTHPKSVTAYYDAGMFYFKKGDYKQTIANLEQVDIGQLTADQQSDVIFSLGYSYFIEKNYDKALVKFEKVQYLESPYKYASSYYLGYIYFKNGEYDKASEVLKKAAENETYASVVPFMIVNIYYHKKNYDEVISYGKEILDTKKKVSNKNEIILLVGTSYFMKNDYPNTVKYLGPYVKGKRSSQSTKYRLAYAAFQVNDYDLAETEFKTLGSAKDSLGQASAYYLGHCYIKHDNKAFAKNSFSVAASVSFNRELQANAIYNLGKLQYEERQFSEAIANLERLNTEFKEFDFPAPRHELLTEAYLNSNNLDDAITYIENIKYPNRRINEIYKEVTYLKGVGLFNRREYNMAIDFFTKSLNTKGEKKFTVLANFWRAESYSTLYEWDKAKNDYGRVFQTADKSNKFYRRARYGIGYAYFNSDKDKESRYDKALEHFENYVTSATNPRKDKYYDDALMRLGDCHYKKKDYDKAINDYKKAIENGSKSSPYGYYQLGNVYGLVEKYNESTQNYDIVITKHQESVYVEDAMYMQAKNFYSIGQYERSIPYYDAYLAKYSSTEQVPIVYLERAVAYLNIKKYESALEDFDEVLYDFCTDTVYSSQALKGCQESLSLLKRSAEYDQRLEQYFKCGGKGKERLTFEAARNNYRNKEFELAIKGFEKLLGQYQESVFTYEVNYYLGMAYYEYGNLVNATDSTVEDNTKVKEYLYKVKKADQKYFFEETLIVLSGVYLQEKNWVKADEINRDRLEITVSEQEKQRILLELIEGTYHLEKYDDCLGYIDQIQQSESRLIYATNKASVYKGKILHKRQEYTKAIDEFILVSNNSKNIYGAEAHYMVAKVQYDQGEFLESLETAKSLMKTRKEFLLWYSESVVLASQCYIALGEEFQGKAYLNSIIQSCPIERVVDHAQQVLDELELKAKEKEKAAESEETENEE